MSTISGNDGVALIGANAIAEVRDFNITTNAATYDDTAKGDEWDTHLIGRKNWQASITCWWDPSDTNGQVALEEGASVTLNLHPEGTGAGLEELTGTATVTSVTNSSPRDGTCEATFQCTGNGALTRQDQS